jgi:extradiol dioxygenase family protein
VRDLEQQVLVAYSLTQLQIFRPQPEHSALFHFSLPVRQFDACLAFYRDCFGAEVQMLSERVANLFVFGGQVTMHDKPRSQLSEDARRTMHFGQIVAPDEWLRLREKIIAAGHSPLHSISSDEAANGRAKLLIVDPSGNLVEINSTAVDV